MRRPTATFERATAPPGIAIASARYCTDGRGNSCPRRRISFILQASSPLVRLHTATALLVDHFRFHPPPLQLDDATRATLLFAFARPNVNTPSTDPVGCWKVSGALGLRARIAARYTTKELRACFSPELAERLVSHRKLQVARSLAFRQAEVAFLQVAQEQHVPVLLLKSAAMRQLGYVNEASRPACDIDVLVAARDIPIFVRALVQASFTIVEQRNAPHHPVTVAFQNGTKVELHVELPGVRVTPDATSARLDDLMEATLIHSPSPQHGSLWLPNSQLLLAHLLVHGIDQHGFTPKLYPAARLICDAVDMGLGHEPELARLAHRLIHRDVTEDEIHSIATLASILEDGRTPEADAPDALPARMLAHLLASMTDERYRARLVFAGLYETARKRGTLHLLRELTHYAFALPSAQLERISGETGRSPLILRLMRPWKMLGRLVAYCVLAAAPHSRRSKRTRPGRSEAT